MEPKLCPALAQSLLALLTLSGAARAGMQQQLMSMSLRRPWQRQSSLLNGHPIRVRPLTPAPTPNFLH